MAVSMLVSLQVSLRPRTEPPREVTHSHKKAECRNMVVVVTTRFGIPRESLQSNTVAMGDGSFGINKVIFDNYVLVPKGAL